MNHTKTTLCKFPVHSRLAISLVLCLCWLSFHSVHGSKPDGYQLEQDWLLHPENFRATITIQPDGHSIVMDNGLIRRTIHRGAWSGTSEFFSHMTQEHLLRAIEPEAILTIDGVTHTIGGIKSQTNHAYLLPDSFKDFQSPDSAWRLSSAEVVPTLERFPWKKTRHTPPVVHWPPMGTGLKTIWVSPDPAYKYIRVEVRYEIYDGIPALMKWIVLHNDTDDSINLDHFIVEKLSVVPYEDIVEYRNIPITPPQSLHVETDYAFQGMTYKNSAHHSVHWIPDPNFTTQVNYLMQTPCLLEVRPKRGPDQTLPPQSSWSSFRVFELAQDSTDRERRGLAHRQFYRRMAPWVTENPLILHVVSVDQKTVHTAIDQAAECGFEMVSLSFGSGLNMEDDSPENLEKFKAFSDYAMQKGIHLGGYSLLSSRRIGDGQDVVSPPGEAPTHGNCPALTSEWGQNYFSRLNQFFDSTGFLQFTHDGSYPGDWDVTPRPPLQKGLNDSQWVQWEIITTFYQKLRATGAYVRVPDYYYLSGANECAMGYREVNWSLPRAEQVLHTRQNIFDGTWQKTPSMGWMFVPLTQYHGGGAAATIEPLAEHLDHYEKMLASNMLLGVQAVYRGLRLYDTPETRDMVLKMVHLYKSHRDILESDLIHIARADGRQPDMMLHVNPSLKEKGFLAVFNPLPTSFSGMRRIPLYYSGLVTQTTIRDASGREWTQPLGPNAEIELDLVIEPHSYTWFSFQ